MGDMQWARYVWRGVELLSLPSPGIVLSLNFQAFTNPKAVWTQSSWVFMEVSLQKHDWLDHWPLVIDRLQVFFPSLKIGDRTENSIRLPYLSPEKPVCRPKATVRTGHRTLDWLKLRKEYVKAVYCHPAYLTFMQSTPCRMPGWMNLKLEWRLSGEISTTSDM